MSYHRVLSSADDRRSEGMVPVRMRNVQVVPAAIGVEQGDGYVLRPRPGVVARITPSAGALLRGLFGKKGFHSDRGYAAAGAALYSIGPGWSATLVGALAGTDTAQFEALYDDLVVLAGGALSTYDTTTYAAVTDPNAPSPGGSLCIFGARAVVHQDGTDINSWSSVTDATSWPALGFAAAEAQPDPIVGNVVIGTQMVSIGATSVQLFNAVGGADEDAIQVDQTFRRHVGALVRDTIAVADEGIFMVGSDRNLYLLAGLNPQRIINRALTKRLQSLTDIQVAALKGFVYKWREKTFYVLKMPDGPAMSYDVETNTFAEYSTFEAETFAFGYAIEMYGKWAVTGPGIDTIYTLDDNAHDDDGEPIECVFTVHVPTDGPTPITSITLDLKTYDVPLVDDAGDPYVPTARVRYYFDGGSLDSVTEWDDEREIVLAGAGEYTLPAPETRFGMAGARGFLMEVTITGPFGWTCGGVWVNEYP